ncbi:MAG: hypothetical protein QOE74_4835 [Mycobacterium sp.]|jgi:hypothetical protein|nr:hypothetical protein [Mycobacterium sp.]
MTTDTQLPSAAVLDEAAAIVEAEWLRLTRDEDQWERELAEFLAELSAIRRRPTRNGNTTAALGRPVAALPPARRSATWRSRRSPAPTALATQRSPPAATSGTTLKDVLDQRR